MDNKYQDLHITDHRCCAIDDIVKRGIKIDRILFFDDTIDIFYYKGNIRYNMSIPYTELQRKSIVID